ncbi:hypothetical protein LCGC14_1863270 [marine sediment metagenome]|uniref:Uncharacterized protein n=1 Tax=marine sediment metagenome TaxID=412755 RepID=A0A0F9G794_9ZZZZ
MFDDNLELLDGSIDYAPATDAAPTSLTRDAATGAAVIDLGTGGTPASGLSCVLILPAANADADILTAVLEVSSAVAFGSDVSEVGKFDLAAATKGIILGSETPCVVVLRFATDKRYVRLNGTVTASDDFKAAKCYLTPYAFTIL